MENNRLVIRCFIDTGMLVMSEVTTKLGIKILRVKVGRKQFLDKREEIFNNTRGGRDGTEERNKQLSKAIRIVIDARKNMPGWDTAFMYLR